MLTIGRGCACESAKVRGFVCGFLNLYRIGGAKCARLCFFWWRRWLVKSVRLFRQVSFLAVRMKSFSVRHRSQRLLKVEYSFALRRILHLIVWLTPARFSSQTCLDSLVLLCVFSCLSEALWLLYLSLNVVDVEPM